MTLAQRVPKARCAPKACARLTRPVPIACAFLGLALSACGTPPPTDMKPWFFPEMVNSVPYDSFAKNPVFKDGKTQQLPPPGTVARGELAFAYGPGPQEALRAGEELKNPLAATPENVKRGDLIFHTICFTCHGALGEGDGPIIPRFPQPPSLTAAHARSLPDGQLVHIITRGQNLMPPHAAQVPLEDRYRLVLYIRSLQSTKGAP